MLTCQFWFHDGVTSVTMETVHASVDLIPEGHGLKYTASFFVCPLSKSEVPFSVSLVNGDPCQKPHHALPVPVQNVTKVKYSVCVTPFNLRYSRAYELVEWMELNLLLGVNRFTFYNYSSRENIRKVLEHYSKRVSVEVMPWNLPMGVATWPRTNNVQIHYFAQLAYANDCVYRHVGRTKYLGLTDLDEFIVPRNNADFTWGDMFSRLPNANAYCFRNTFFRKEWNSTSDRWQTIAQKYKLVSLLKLKHETKVWPPFQRSKMIVRPEKIHAMGIHNVHKMKSVSNNKATHIVDPDVGLLHHYRNYDQPNDHKERLSDNTMEKFGKDLINKVQDTWQKLSGVDFDISIL